MFTPARRNGTLGLNGLDAGRRDRLQHANPRGWFLCVAIPPRSGPLHTQSPDMSHNQPMELPDGGGDHSQYILPHRIYRILDTTAQMADAARGIIRSRHPEAIRVHSICALVWLFRVRRAFGRYWHQTLPPGSEIIRHRLNRLRRLVARCHDSALVKMVNSAPFRDIRADERLADQTHRWDPALFDDRRYRLLTDNDLAYITEGIKEYADGIRRLVSTLRQALWEELDRAQNCPLSPTMRDADEVDAFFRSDRWHNLGAWRKTAYQLPMLSEAKAQRRDGPAAAPVWLSGPDENVILWGKPKPPLPPAQYGVVKALVEAHAANERLSKTQLEKRAKDERGNPIEDPVGALERLSKKDSDWKQAIDMAKVAGRGYCLNDRPRAPISTHDTAHKNEKPTHPDPPTKTRNSPMPTHKTAHKTG